MIGSVLFLLGAVLFQSAKASETFVTTAVTFDGGAPYSAAELQSACGLRPGRTVSKAEIEAATKRLADTGLFEDARYDVKGPAIHFHLKPIQKADLLAVHYTNFVFDVPSHWNAEVAKRVPLYRGELPAHGQLEVEVEHALEAALRERGVAATVHSAVDNEAVNYSIVSPPVVVDKVEIAAGLAKEAEDITASLRRLSGSAYAEGATAENVRRTVVEGFQDSGYLDVAADAPEAQKPRITQEAVLVDLRETVRPGPRYRVGAVTLPEPALQVPEALLREAVLVKTGEVASRVKVLRSMSRLEETFRDRGYLAMEMKVEPRKDAAAQTVSYAFTANPGTRYRFRNLFIVGLGEDVTEYLRKSWKMSPGDPYDGVEVIRLLATPAARANCKGGRMTAALAPDAKLLLVDVTLSCRKG